MRGSSAPPPPPHTHPHTHTHTHRSGYEESEEGYNAEWALEEMEEAEAEERETEEVEDLLEYYLQRAAATQSASTVSSMYSWITPSRNPETPALRLAR